MFKSFVRNLVKEVREIFKEEQMNVKVWNYPQRVQKIQRTEIWVVEGSKDYCKEEFHDCVDNFAVYIRAKLGDKWFMVNKHGCPVGAPYEQKTTDKWKLVKRIG